MAEGALLIAFITVQRLGELVLARRNTRQLLAQGGIEFGRSHYRWMVALHAAWLAGLWWLGRTQPVDPLLLGVFILLQAGRLWVIATLGRRWTTRIVVLPRAPLVAHGPYRWLKTRITGSSPWKLPSSRWRWVCRYWPRFLRC